MQKRKGEPISSYQSTIQRLHNRNPLVFTVPYIWGLQEKCFLRSVYKLLQMLIILAWLYCWFKTYLLLAVAGWLSETEQFTSGNREVMKKNPWRFWVVFHLPRTQLEHQELRCLSDLANGEKKDSSKKGILLTWNVWIGLEDTNFPLQTIKWDYCNLHFMFSAIGVHS